MVKSIRSPARDVPVLGAYDVVVCGGGAAGCAAAVASARLGAETYQARKARMLAGDSFDIPYGCLVASGVDNLLVAGRCLSAERCAQASLRIQQTCQSTGQAAGAMAALSLRNGVTPRELDPAVAIAYLAQARDVEPAFAELADIPIAESAYDGTVTRERR